MDNNHRRCRLRSRRSSSRSCPVNLRLLKRLPRTQQRSLHSVRASLSSSRKQRTKWIGTCCQWSVIASKSWRVNLNPIQTQAILLSNRNWSSQRITTLTLSARLLALFSNKTAARKSTDTAQCRSMLSGCITRIYRTCTKRFKVAAHRHLKIDRALASPSPRMRLIKGLQL